MKSVADFKNRDPFDKKEQIPIALIGPYRFQGATEALDGTINSSQSMRCVTQSAKVLAIEREHFELILK